jgi:hypothetical protein
MDFMAGDRSQHRPAAPEHADGGGSGVVEFLSQHENEGEAPALCLRMIPEQTLCVCRGKTGCHPDHALAAADRMGDPEQQYD